MASFVQRAIGCAIILGVLSSSADGTNCPHCVGVMACDRNQTIPSVACSTAIVNRTVLPLYQYYIDLAAFIAPSTQYSCVKVEYSPQANSSNTFAVQGCASGTKSICSAPSRDIVGSLRCSYYSSGQSFHDLRHSVLTGLLLNMAVIVSAFALSC